MSVATTTAPQGFAAATRSASDGLGMKGWGLILLIPYVLVFALFVVYPVLYGFWLGSRPEIYAQLFQDPAFWTSYFNTIVFLLVAVNLKFVLALALSGYFVVQRPWIQVMLVLFILPWAMPSIPTILSFRFMLNAEWGIINMEYFRWTFLDGPGWLNRPDLAFMWSMIVHIWKSLPFWTLILITGRLAISNDLYEAASVDGASRWQQFRHITWPSLATLYITSTMLSMIWTLGDFNSVYLLTAGGPGDKTHVLATLGVRYLRIDQLELGIAAIITAMPIVIPMVWFMVRRLSKGPGE